MYDATTVRSDCLVCVYLYALKKIGSNSDEIIYNARETTNESFMCGVAYALYSDTVQNAKK